VRVYPTLESDVADMQQAVQQQTMTQQPVSGRVCGQQLSSTVVYPTAAQTPRVMSRCCPPTQPPPPPPPPPPLRNPQGGHSHHTDSVVKMKSLPFDATQLDIIQFFEAFKLKPNGVQLVVRSDNKPTGEVRGGGWGAHTI
jgi:hypothetical protein